MIDLRRARGGFARAKWAICLALLWGIAPIAQAAVAPEVPAETTQIVTIDPDQTPEERTGPLAAECDADDADACTRLGYIYNEGDGVPADDARATPLFVRACHLGDMSGCTMAGYAYGEGRGVERSPERAALIDEASAAEARAATLEEG